MSSIQFSRRDVLCASTAIVAAALAQPVRAQTRAVAAEPITPALIEAAKKEGKLAFYTAMDLAFAQQLGKAFEEKFSGISVRVERSGAERIFTRIAQEYGANIHVVDVVNTGTWRTASRGSATAGWRRTCRRRSRSISSRNTTTRMACTS